MNHIVNVFKMLALLFGMADFDRKQALKTPTLGWWSPNSTKEPRVGTFGSAGIDVRASEDVTLMPGVPTSIGTDLFFTIPKGYNLEVRGRSGWAFNHHVFSFNGTIDDDYTGELKMLLINHGTQPFWVREGQFVAQVILHETVPCHLKLTDTKPYPTAHTGFGSTGTGV